MTEYRGLRELLDTVPGRVAIEPDPLFARLAKIAEELDPGGRYECPVEGCGWAFDVPGPVMSQTDEPLTISWLGASRRKVEEVFAAHLDAHAVDGAPPPTEPPSWAELEWCDGGGSCEHGACLDWQLSVEP